MITQWTKRHGYHLRHATKSNGITTTTTTRVIPVGATNRLLLLPTPNISSSSSGLQRHRESFIEFPSRLYHTSTHTYRQKEGVKKLEVEQSEVTNVYDMSNESLSPSDEQAAFLLASFIQFVVIPSSSSPSKENSNRLGFYIGQLLNSSQPEHVLRIMQLLSPKLQISHALLLYSLNKLLCDDQEDVGNIKKLEKKVKEYERVSDMATTVLRPFLNGKKVLVDKDNFDFPAPTLTIESFCRGLEEIMSMTGAGSLHKQVDLLGDLLSQVSNPREARGVFMLLAKSENLSKTVFHASVVANAFAMAVAHNNTLNTGKHSEEYLISCFAQELANGRTIEQIAADVIQNRNTDMFGDPSADVSHSPMLAKSGLNFVKVLDTNSDVRLECKYDGNRLQIKYIRGSIKYYSRAQNELSATLYPLNKEVKSIVKPSVGSCLIDCEIYPYDEENDIPMPFQFLQPQIAKLSNSSERMPVRVAVFDLLLLNGQTTINLSLQERLALLDEHFNLSKAEGHSGSSDSSNEPKPMFHQTYSEIIKGDLPLDDKVEIFNKAFRKCVDGRYEGLIMKYMDEAYIPATRRWYKYKKDFDKSVFDTLDLVCIGVSKGKGSREGYYSSLLVAAYNETTNNYETVAKVSGISLNEAKHMMKDWAPYIIDTPQDNYVVSSVMKRSIDIWLKPHAIIEVTGMEFTQSPQHTCGSNQRAQRRGISLRFPSFIRRREGDKSLKDATTVAQIVEMVENTFVVKGGDKKE